MITLGALTGLLLLCSATTGTIQERESLVITDRFYHENLVIYTGQNEITRIVVPLNSINFNEDTVFAKIDIYVFFVEAGKGLYVLKNDVATKLLDNGKDIASSMDDSTQVFLGATDGIYTFNAEKNIAEKYGTLTDNIKNILVTNGTEDIYILTEDSRFYKVTDEGTKKEEIPNVKDAQQVVLDTVNNLYFVNSKQRVYIRSYEDGKLKKVKRLPVNAKSVELIRPPAILEDGIPIFVDNKGYSVNSNGNSRFASLVLETTPTAFSVEATLFLFVAHDKKIYQYSVIEIMESEEDFMAPVKTYLDDKSTNIKENAIKKTLRQ